MAQILYSASKWGEIPEGIDTDLGVAVLAFVDSLCKKLPPRAQVRVSWPLNSVHIGIGGIEVLLITQQGGMPTYIEDKVKNRIISFDEDSFGDIMVFCLPFVANTVGNFISGSPDEAISVILDTLTGKFS